MNTPNGFTLIRSLTWDEVFDLWRQNEDTPRWEAVYTTRGFATWAEWRMTYADPWRCPELRWALYRIDSPTDVVPQFIGGRFRTWVEKYYGKRYSPTFSELIQHPELSHHANIDSMMRDFPRETTITALFHRGENAVAAPMVIEGMHRCCAIAKAAALSHPINAELFVAMAESPDKTLPVLGQNTST